MNPQSLKIGKIVTGVLWVVLGAAFFCPHDSSLLTGMRFGFWALLAAHAVECLIFLPGLKASGKPLPGQIIQVLLFGIIHYKTLTPAK
jgi:uncharacterized protein YhhL (DUF1145 family)